MSTISSILKAYEDLSKIVKIVLQIFLGALVSGVYRILRYFETKNIVTLVAGILCFIPGLCFVFWVIDLISVITKEKIYILVD